MYEDDYERAMALLERNQMIPEQLKYCPCCHSPHIKFVLKKSHSFRRSWPPYSVSWPAHLRARRIGNMYAKTVGRTLKRPWHDKEKRHKTPPHPTQNEHQTCTIHRYARHHGIFDHARKFMRENGNPYQWTDGYPSEDSWKRKSDKDTASSAKTKRTAW